jgi:hypothetical protein
MEVNMQIYCRQCGAEIRAEDINLDKMIAKCSQCNAIFSFADMYGEDSHKKKKVDFSNVPMPNNMSIDNSGSTLVIERKWFSFSHIFLAIFAVIWNGMIWTIFVPNFAEAGAAGFGIFPLFLLPFILVGIGVAYVALAGFLNTTTIHVDNMTLTVHHHPLPFINKTVPTNDIEQLYTKQQISRSKNGTTVSYQLHIIKYDGKNQRLLQSLDNPEQAIFIEQEVERFLDIEDRPVRGEYR